MWAERRRRVERRARRTRRVAAAGEERERGREERDKANRLGFRSGELDRGLIYENVEGFFAKSTQPCVTTRRSQQCPECSGCSEVEGSLINPDVPLRQNTPKLP
jgi:hypothetical protein